MVSFMSKFEKKELEQFPKKNNILFVFMSKKKLIIGQFQQCKIKLYVFLLHAHIILFYTVEITQL
jgi:hypothetical protein